MIKFFSPIIELISINLILIFIVIPVQLNLLLVPQLVNYDLFVPSFWCPNHHLNASFR